MIEWRERTNRLRHRLPRGLDVAGWRVDVAFDEAPAGVATSAKAARLAEDLVAARLGCERRVVHVAALMPSGRPVATVQGREPRIFVSVSHGGGLVGAAICDRGSVGRDIVEAAEAGRSLEAWFTADELAMVSGDDGWLRARLWAAKEAAFKAARLDEVFRPRAVAIECRGPAGFRWSVRGRQRRVDGQGLFTSAGRKVVAVAVAAAAPNFGNQARSA